MLLLFNSIEIQRDEALQNLMEAHDSLEDYQRRIKDKVKKVIYIFHLGILFVEVYQVY